MGIYWQLNSLHLQIILSHSICISTCRCRFWEFFVLFLQGTSSPGCHRFCYQTIQNLWTEFHYQPKRVFCLKKPCRSWFGPQLDCLDVRAMQEHHEGWSFPVLHWWHRGRWWKSSFLFSHGNMPNLYCDKTLSRFKWNSSHTSLSKVCFPPQTLHFFL